MDEVVDGLLKTNPFLANKPRQPIGGGTVKRRLGWWIQKMNPFQLLKMGYGTKGNRRLTRASFYFPKSRKFHMALTLPEASIHYQQIRYRKV
ncbi:hypothetical protein P7H17_16580 [Paenibacillus larvae]|nr:hypothetical protein [Paenibacillus larvae]MDT2287324.1 hypothetical protein [Paenibacillus larvae]